jgi:hypothetical protein
MDFVSVQRKAVFLCGSSGAAMQWKTETKGGEKKSAN